MNIKVMFTHSNKSRAHTDETKIRKGKEIYRHPENRFVVLEFEGAGGKFREAFWPEQIIQNQ